AKAFKKKPFVPVSITVSTINKRALTSEIFRIGRSSSLLDFKYSPMMQATVRKIKIDSTWPVLIFCLAKL
ncbi:MAG: hypothetical protein QME06_11290, partial [Desulfobacterales bacterium]|nr:hypothetical protein [Desulfobacterales bacterium]